MNKIDEYDFLDYDYYGEYNFDPLYILLINEQFKYIRESFYQLDNDTKNILNYFVIQREDFNNLDLNIDKYIRKLRKKYLELYNAN